MNNEWNYEIINLLMEMGADVNLADPLGETPLHRVCKVLVGSERREWVEKLLKAGARPLLVDQAGRTAFDVLKQHQPDADTSRLLLEKQADALIQAAALANQEGDSEAQAKAMQHISKFGNQLSGDEMKSFVDALKAAATLHHLGAEFRIEKIWVPKR